MYGPVLLIVGAVVTAFELFAKKKKAKPALVTPPATSPPAAEVKSDSQEPPAAE